MFVEGKVSEELARERMQEIDEATLRARLKAKRDSLFDEFRRNPSKVRLAIEIKLIDDEVAKTDALQAIRKRA